MLAYIEKKSCFENKCVTQNLPRWITDAGKSAAQCWPAILCYIGQQLGQGMCIYLHIQWLSLSASRMQPGILSSLLVDGQSTPGINQKQPLPFHFRDVLNLPVLSFAWEKVYYVIYLFFLQSDGPFEKASLQRETPLGEVRPIDGSESPWSKVILALALKKRGPSGKKVKKETHFVNHQGLVSFCAWRNLQTSLWIIYLVELHAGWHTRGSCNQTSSLR